MRIGIEINHVLRDINKQILKHYKKAFDPSLDIDNIDTTIDENVWNVANFESSREKLNFMYIDYPFELFGAANAAEKNLGGRFTVWLEDIEDMDDETPIEICMFSRGEEALTIQSTYFFLSKFGCRSREVLMPAEETELYDKFDAIVSYDRNFLRNGPEELKKVLITRGHQEDGDDKFDIFYENMSKLMEDKEFFNKLNGSDEEK